MFGLRICPKLNLKTLSPVAAKNPKALSPQAKKKHTTPQECSAVVMVVAIVV